MPPARKKLRSNPKAEKKFIAVPLLSALESVLAQLKSGPSREAWESDVDLPLGCSLGDAATLIAQRLAATGQATLKFDCQAKHCVGSIPAAFLSRSSSSSSQPSVAATNGRDVLISLPTAVFSHVLSYLSLREFFSVLVPVSSSYVRFFYRKSVLPFSDHKLIVCENDPQEDEEVPTVSYGDGYYYGDPVIPWTVLVKLGHLGLNSISIACCRLSLNILANPRTRHLRLDLVDLKNDVLAPLARMTSLETLKMKEVYGETDSLRHLQGLPLTRLEISMFSQHDRMQMPLDTLTGMPLRKFILSNCIIHSLEAFLPRGLPLRELTFKSCKIPRLDHLRHYPLKRLTLRNCPGIARVLGDSKSVLSELPLLEELDLTGSGVGDKDLFNLAKFIPTLKKLGLAGRFKRRSELTGEGLVALSGLSVEDLDLAFTGVTDAGLSALHRLSLKSLNLFGCKKLTGECLAALSGLPLENLDLSDTNVTDASLSFLRGLPLKELRLAGCSNITGTGAAALSHLGRLNIMYE
eukprot:gb/GEZN01004468.1/.p1 GENE.gb/GEZN01004468.1/~~gb/GEZN01004468.1/.p1  ORF type:complete len:522 (-),score=47.09 gb/GEZN01004468.1/:320-1885(-)